MPRSEKQKLKLYLIIDYFKRKSDEEHPVSIVDIIDYLGGLGITAERKSIYRDINAMEKLGYEIVQVHDKKFRYYLANRKFELAELRMLVDVVQASRFITKKKSNALIKKLESLTSEYAAEKLQSQVFVTNRIKNSNESIYYNVDIIHMAINSNCCISFNYFEWDMNRRRKYRRRGKTYEVSPWALVWHNENYYLIAFDNMAQMIKHYRVDRMNNIESSDVSRSGEKEFRNVDIAGYVKKFFGMYGGEMTMVTLNCKRELANAVIDRFGTDIQFMPRPDSKSFDIEVEVAISPVFLSWVFMFGGGIRILSPTSAAEKLKEMAAGFLKQDDEEN